MPPETVGWQSLTPSGPEFVEFKPIARLRRPVVITEKIDGTNGVVWVGESGEVRPGSRSQWIGLGNDNHGFAKWVAEHAEELRGLGAGYHYGEWWGSGVQRGYGLTKGEKRFSLFNVARWGESRPACCDVVPVLAQAEVFSTALVDEALERLRQTGSVAAPGFMRPEGVVIFHKHSNALFKVTLEKDEVPKHMQGVG